MCGTLGCATTNASGPHARDTAATAPEATPEVEVAAAGNGDLEGPTRAEVARVDRWPLAGPLPETIGIATAHEPGLWFQALQAEVDRRPGVVLATRGMTCAAREAGLFWARHDRMPDLLLTRFMAARCGSPASGVGLQVLSGDVGPGESDADVYGRWAGDIEKMLAGSLQGGPMVAGVTFIHAEGRAALVLAVGRRTAHIDPFSPLPDANRNLVVTGELLESAESVAALVGKGAFGASWCAADASVALPKFAFTCTVDPSDSRAWLEVALHPPGRIIGRPILETLVWPNGTPDNTFHRPALPDPGPEGGVTESFVAMVNGLRGSLGQEPLTVSAAQSEVATEAAPYYFAAGMGDIPETAADAVILGLLSGARVESMVSRGRVGATWAQHPVSVDALLATAIQRPSNRLVLFDEGAAIIAIAPVVLEGGELPRAALFATYRSMQDLDLPALTREVLDQINRARAEGGTAPATLLTELDPVAVRVSRALLDGQLDPNGGLESMLTAVAEATHKSVSGWVLQVGELDGLELPSQLVEQRTLEVGISVGVHKAEGESWARYVIMVVFPVVGPTI